MNNEIKDAITLTVTERIVKMVDEETKKYGGLTNKIKEFIIIETISGEPWEYSKLIKNILEKFKNQVKDMLEKCIAESVYEFAQKYTPEDIKRS